MTRRRSGLEQQLAAIEKLSRDVEDASVLHELGASEKDESTQSEVPSQLPKLELRVRGAELERMLSGPVDHANAIVSIHPGTGGNDAKDWAEMLVRMFLRWAERRGYKTEIIDKQEGDEAGIDGASFSVQGDHAFGYLRSENGVHRLVRHSRPSGRERAAADRVRRRRGDARHRRRSRHPGERRRPRDHDDARRAARAARTSTRSRPRSG